MMQPELELYVAFYRPRQGNYSHWALYIDDEYDPVIFEVVGKLPQFERSIRHTRPENSARFLGKQFVGIILRSDVPDIWNIASSANVDNETMEWDCQDYVLEVLGLLADNYILDEQNEDFCEALDLLEWKRGPIL